MKKTKNLYTLFMVVILIVSIIASGCKKDEDNIDTVSNSFEITSPEIGQNSLLPIDYTCDGESATLPLDWRGYPENTQSFALIMHHEASPTDIHWYWILYNISATVQSLPKNVSGIGTMGNNRVNGKTEYSPPCSQGPGLKTYFYTIYALSEMLELNVSPEDVNRDVLLDAMDGIILSTDTFTVGYSREF